MGIGGIFLLPIWNAMSVDCADICLLIPIFIGLRQSMSEHLSHLRNPYTRVGPIPVIPCLSPDG